MYLLNLHTMKLESFSSPESAPAYAILSHTWSTGEADEEPEILFHEWTSELQEKILQEVQRDQFSSLGSSAASQGVRIGRKLVDFCRLALAYELEYRWIDTICIDKRVCYMFSGTCGEFG